VAEAGALRPRERGASDGGVSNIWCAHGQIIADMPENGIPGFNVVHFDAGI